MIGSRLRRALKHRDADARVAVLICTLRNIEVMATHFAQRLRRRTTRVWAMLACAGAAETLTVGALSTLHLADTS